MLHTDPLGGRDDWKNKVLPLLSKNAVSEADPGTDLTACLTALLLCTLTVSLVQYSIAHTQHSTCNLNLRQVYSSLIPCRFALVANKTSKSLNHSCILPQLQSDMKHLTSTVLPLLFILGQFSAIVIIQAASIDTKHAINQRPRSFDHAQRASHEAQVMVKRVSCPHEINFLFR